MTVIRTGLGMVVLALVMTGVAGTIYKITSPDGWIAGAFGRSISAGFAMVASLLVVIAFAWFSRGFALHFRNRYADLFVYTFAAAGFLYLAHYWLRGHF
jgi:hypothetical protein